MMYQDRSSMFALKARGLADLALGNLSQDKDLYLFK